MYEIKKIFGVSPAVLGALHALLQGERLKTVHPVWLPRGNDRTLDREYPCCAELISSKCNPTDHTYTVEIKVWIVIEGYQKPEEGRRPQKLRIIVGRQVLDAIHGCLDNIFPAEEVEVKLSHA